MTLRVAMICTYYAPLVSGIAVQVQDTARALARDGAEIHVLTRRWEQNGHDEVQTTEADGVVVHRFAIGEQRWQASSSFILQVAQEIRRFQPNVIHAHELLLPTTAALVAKRVTGRPVVATVHMGGEELGECSRLQRAALGRQRVKYVRHAVDRFVAISRAVADDMAAIGIPADKQVFIPNGIDMTRFAPVTPEEKVALRHRYGLPAGPLAIYTGRVSSEKRVVPLAERWSSVRQAFPDAAFVVVGSGPLQDDLCNLQAPGVYWVGPQKDVVPYLQAADLFVLPSAAEGFSISTLEALACGLPTVGTNVGAVPELVVHGAGGRLVQADDMAGFVEALCDMFAQRDMWPAMGEAARSHVLQHYSLPVIVQRLLRLYREF
jgi:glycosyltransferase involved in cell wall biosynthesis